MFKGLSHVIHAAVNAGKKLEQPFAAYGRTFKNGPSRTPPFVVPMSPTVDQTQAELPGVLATDPKDLGYSDDEPSGSPSLESSLGALPEAAMPPVPEESISAGPVSGDGIPVMADTSVSAPFPGPRKAAVKPSVTLRTPNAHAPVSDLLNILLAKSLYNSKAPSPIPDPSQFLPAEPAPGSLGLSNASSIGPRQSPFQADANAHRPGWMANLK